MQEVDKNKEPTPAQTSAPKPAPAPVIIAAPQYPRPSEPASATSLSFKDVPNQALADIVKGADFAELILAMAQQKGELRPETQLSDLRLKDYLEEIKKLAVTDKNFAAASDGLGGVEKLIGSSSYGTLVDLLKSKLPQELQTEAWSKAYVVADKLQKANQSAGTFLQTPEFVKYLGVLSDQYRINPYRQFDDVVASYLDPARKGLYSSEEFKQAYLTAEPRSFAVFEDNSINRLKFVQSLAYERRGTTRLPAEEFQNQLALLERGRNAVSNYGLPPKTFEDLNAILLCPPDRLAVLEARDSQQLYRDLGRVAPSLAAYRDASSLISSGTGFPDTVEALRRIQNPPDAASLEQILGAFGASLKDGILGQLGQNWKPLPLPLEQIAKSPLLRPYASALAPLPADAPLGEELPGRIRGFLSLYAASEYMQTNKVPQYLPEQDRKNVTLAVLVRLSGLSSVALPEPYNLLWNPPHRPSAAKEFGELSGSAMTEAFSRPNLAGLEKALTSEWGFPVIGAGTFVQEARSDSSLNYFLDGKNSAAFRELLKAFGAQVPPNTELSDASNLRAFTEKSALLLPEAQSLKSAFPLVSNGVFYDSMAGEIGHAVREPGDARRLVSLYSRLTGSFDCGDPAAKDLIFSSVNFFKGTLKGLDEKLSDPATQEAYSRIRTLNQRAVNTGGDLPLDRLLKVDAPSVARSFAALEQLGINLSDQRNLEVAWSRISRDPKEVAATLQSPEFQTRLRDSKAASIDEILAILR